MLLVVIAAACADTATAPPSTTQAPRGEPSSPGDVTAAPPGSDGSGGEEGTGFGGASAAAGTPEVLLDAAGLAEAVAVASGLSGLLSVPDRFDVCGVRPDGSVACWSELDSTLVVREGPFSAISVGVVDDACGLRPVGAVECWDYRGPNERDDPPAGVFSAVGVGVSRSCGLRLDGSVECWRYSGSDRRREVGEREHEVPDPGGVFSAVSVGYHHVCGLRPDESVACWGEDWFGQSDPPEGRFLAVDAGVSHSCGLRPDGSAACWGEDSMDSGLLGWSDDYRAFRHFGDESGERVYVEDQLERLSDLEMPQPPMTFMTAADVVRDADLLAAMVERAAGWEPPPGPYKALSAGAGFTCGLRLNGEVSCWGYLNNGEPRIPLAVYAEVSGDRVRELFANKQAEVESYRAERESAGGRDGAESGEVTAGAPEGDREAAERRAWLAHIETLSAYRTMLAYVDLVAPPSGPFIAVEAGDLRACGLRADGEIACWGYEGGEESSPPPGPFATTPFATHTVTPDEGAAETFPGRNGDGSVVVDRSGDVSDVVRVALWERPEGLPEAGCAGRWVPGRQVRSFTGTVKDYPEGFAPRSPVTMSVVGLVIPREWSDVSPSEVEAWELSPVELPPVTADAQGRIVVVWAVPEPPQEPESTNPAVYAVRAEGKTPSGITVEASSFQPHMVYPDLGPCAHRDDVTTTSGRAVRVDVLANDVAPTGGTLDPASVEVAPGRGRGEFVVDPADGSITFTPSRYFVGIATARYTVSDTWGTEVSSYIRVTVTED